MAIRMFARLHVLLLIKSAAATATATATLRLPHGKNDFVARLFFVFC